MKAHQASELKTLTPDELHCVSGSGAMQHREVRAQDMYGNTVSVEEYMDLQLLAMYRGGDAMTIFDFYERGFDRHKPHIYKP